MTPKAKNLIQLNIAILMWGGTAMFAKGIALPVTSIICIRSLIACAALFFFMRATGQTTALKSRRHLGVMIGLGVLLCLHWLAYFQSLKVSVAAIATLSLHTYPVFTALIEPLVFREKLRKEDMALAAIVFAGLAVMTPSLDLANSTTQGILFGIVSGLFFMVRNLITRRFVREYSSSSFMFWQSLVTGVVLLPILAFSSEQTYSQGTIGLFVLLGVLFTAVPHTMYSASFRHLSVKTVGVLAMLVPFYGTLLGYLIHQETVTVRTGIGGCVILACVIYETVKHTQEPKLDKPFSVGGDTKAQRPEVPGASST